MQPLIEQKKVNSYQNSKWVSLNTLPLTLKGRGGQPFIKAGQILSIKLLEGQQIAQKRFGGLERNILWDDSYNEMRAH